jgi:hypothetical protein
MASKIASHKKKHVKSTALTIHDFSNGGYNATDIFIMSWSMGTCAFAHLRPGRNPNRP